MTQQNRKQFLEGVSAVQSDSNSSIIGYLTWYSVGDDLYNREELRKELLRNGIEEAYLPNPIRPTDAFRRATKAIETRRHHLEEVAQEYLNTMAIFILAYITNRIIKEC